MSGQWQPQEPQDLTRALALELSFRAGERLRKDLLEAGLTEAEVDDVVEKALAWRYEETHATSK